MMRETQLSVNDLVAPLFVREGITEKSEIPSMPGVFHVPYEGVVEEARSVVDLGIPAVLLFGIPLKKDPNASSASSSEGVVQQAVTALKEAYGDRLVVITDVCLCQYTTSGHCGVVSDGSVLNDPSLDLLTKVARSHAEAGADMVAPSDMMDGRVGAIRTALDGAGYEHIGIMSYAAKFASSFYGPFREAAYSTPQFGDRRSYQMDPANGEEALREVALDIDEGADIVMVKPALPYLDIIRRVKERFGHPTAAYNVSGEYSMVKAAARSGWLDERATAMEVLTSIKRAGADLIITYFAKDAARWLKEV
jgi:porphobilinogen synthase